MDKVPLTEYELQNTRPGEAITLAGVMAILVTAIVVVVVWKLYSTSDGSVTLPGGYKFVRS